MKRTTEKNLMVFSGRAHPRLAEEVAELLGTGLVPTSAYDFANSEIYVRFEESVRGSDAFVIQSHTAPVNEWIMEHLIMVDALKRASADRKSTRLNSSHANISYAVFCLKKKKQIQTHYKTKKRKTNYSFNRLEPW